MDDGSGWPLDVALSEPNPYPTDSFGSTLALRDGLLVSGERTESSQVHIFGKDENGDWQHLTEVYGSEAKYTVAVSASTLVIGVPAFGRVRAYDLAARLPDTGNDDSGDGTNDETGGSGDSGDEGDDENVATGGGMDEDTDEDSGDDAGGSGGETSGVSGGTEDPAPDSSGGDGPADVFLFCCLTLLGSCRCKVFTRR